MAGCSCADRPLPIPPSDAQVVAVDGAVDLSIPDLSTSDLSCERLDCTPCGASCCCGAETCGHTLDGDVCLGDCIPIGDPCASPVDCCSLSCDPQTHTCSVVGEVDLAPGCNPMGDCVPAGGACTTSADCCSCQCVVAQGQTMGVCSAP